MTPTDETLMAYADGVLSGEEASAVEAAMTADPDLRRHVEAHRALSDSVASAYAGVLNEPVPERLTQAAQRRGRPTLPAWAAVAAALTVAVLAGLGAWSMGQDGLTGGADGRQARGALKAELESGLASAPSGGVAQVGLTYRTSDGYCRTFAVRDDAPWSGVACRKGKDWVIRTRVKSPAGDAPAPAYRQATSTLPSEILTTIEATMVGEPLDATQEAAARASGWR